ncbi:MAG: hypothetical protein AABX98_00200 [Nanoarchaeota archaeon]|mgnify:FL=1
MLTTIQVTDKTLHLLKKIKQETASQSYDEAITKLVVEKSKPHSLAGFLGKRSTKEILSGLREKHDRF